MQDEAGGRTGAANRKPDEQKAAPSPYVGLRPYSATEAAHFFGRETLVASMLARLKQNNFLALVGPAGSGKSSVVQAGLLPKLAQGREIAGSDRWHVLIVRPADQPLASLALAAAGELQAAAELAQSMAQDAKALAAYLGRSPQRTLVVVDQFEELFTLCPDKRTRAAYIANLLAAADAGSAIVVIILRSDFYSECAAYPDLRAALTRSQEFIGMPTHDELRSAIVMPAVQDGWEIEPQLVDQLIVDVMDEPGALPLLQQALYLLWQNRRDQTLTLQTYNELGGIKQLVSTSADAAFAALTPGQQGMARAVLLHLVDAESEGAETRRPVRLADFAGSGADSTVQAVIGSLADERLISVGAPEGSGGAEFVDLAHDALVSSWPRMRIWLDEDRELLRLRQELAADADRWRAQGRDPSLLYGGKRLAQIVRGEHELDLFLAPGEKEFLDASLRAAKDQDLEHEQLELELESLQQQLAAERARSEQLRQEGEALKQQLQAAQAAGFVPIADPELREIMSGLGALRIATFSPDQFRDFLEALLRAFDLSGLRLLLRTRLGEANPEALLLPAADLRDNIYAILRWAELRGRVRDLVVATLLENPTNPQLRAFAKKILAAAQQGA